MERKRVLRIGIIALIVAVVSLGIGFAALATTLTIGTGTGVVQGRRWDVHISNVQGSTGPSGSSFTTQPTLTNPTTISSWSMRWDEPDFGNPGQLWAWTSIVFNINNNGDFNARLESLNIGQPTCSVAGDTSHPDAIAVCDSIVPRIDNYSGGDNFTTNYILNPGASIQLGFVIGNSHSVNWPENTVDITFGETTMSWVPST